MKKKQILLTFDFELFLGENSGSVENCLVKPCEKLLEIVSKYKLSTVFFVDTLYLYRLKQVSKSNQLAINDFQAILDILRKFIDAGSYIFHHLHPHWLDAVYLENDNQWNVSNKERFALSNLSETEVEQVFNYSDEIISEIYKGKNKPTFSGFRAGGLYAQPFNDFKKSMKKYAILMDFSVLKNAKSQGDNGKYKFDYSTYPSEPIFRFSNEVNEKDEEGEFIEITMDQFQMKTPCKVINGLYYRQNFKKESWQRWGDGKSSGNILKSTDSTNKWRTEETFSIELLNDFKARLYSKYVDNKQFTHVISHPKLFSPANLQAFELFISTISSKYQLETDVLKIIEINNIKIN